MTAAISSKMLERARDQLYFEGITVAEWARQRGFSEQLTYSLLAGRLRAKRGRAHDIAVALGLKPSQEETKVLANRAPLWQDAEGSS